MMQTHKSALTLMLLLLSICQIAGCATNQSLEQMQADYDAEVARLRGETYRALYESKIKPDFENRKLSEVLRELQRAANIDIVARWYEEGYRDGLDPQAPITFRTDRELRVINALEQCVQFATSEETTWNLRPGYIEVGKTFALATSEHYTVAYPISWLLDNSPVFDGMPEKRRSQLAEFFEVIEAEMKSEDYDGGYSTPAEEFAEELIDLMTSVCEPLQWERNGGEGGLMRYLNGCFIINAADFLHRKIGRYRYGASLAER